MKTEIREIYKCDHCNKLYQVKRFAIAHEEICSSNPDNRRPCFECSNLCKKKVDIYYDMPWGSEAARSLAVLYCKENKTYLYPPKVEIRGNAFDLGDHLNEPMPKSCDKVNHEFPIDFD